MPQVKVLANARAHLELGHPCKASSDFSRQQKTQEKIPASAVFYVSEDTPWGNSLHYNQLLWFPVKAKGYEYAAILYGDYLLSMSISRIFMLRDTGLRLSISRGNVSCFVFSFCSFLFSNLLFSFSLPSLFFSLFLSCLLAFSLAPLLSAFSFLFSPFQT